MQCSSKVFLLLSSCHLVKMPVSLAVKIKGFSLANSKEDRCRLLVLLHRLVNFPKIFYWASGLYTLYISIIFLIWDERKRTLSIVLSYWIYNRFYCLSSHCISNYWLIVFLVSCIEYIEYSSWLMTIWNCSKFSILYRQSP